MPDAEKLRRLLTAAVERRVFPGCALGRIADGRESFVAVGRHTYDASSPPVGVDTLFDCASVTKSVPTAALALMMIDRGALGPNDRLIDFVPEYRGAFREGIAVEHLLTHTLDFDFRLSDLKALAAADLLDAVLNASMKHPPGVRFHYANATSVLLGMLVERVGGKPLHILAQENIFDPLGMTDTTFSPNADALVKCAPTEIDPWRGRVICGETHDESAWRLREIMTAGSAGMFSTAADLLKFVRTLVGGGAPLFGAKITRAMHTNRIPHIASQRAGLGWELDREYMGASRSPSTIGKTGFTGAALIMNIPEGRGLVMLSNRTWPARGPSRGPINEVRAAAADMIL